MSSKRQASVVRSCSPVADSRPNFCLVMTADTLLHGLMASGTLGAVSGLANICPFAAVRVVKLFQEGKIAEAQKAQGELSMAGEIELKGGVPGMRVSLLTFGVEEKKS